MARYQTLRTAAAAGAILAILTAGHVHAEGGESTGVHAATAAYAIGQIEEAEPTAGQTEPAETGPQDAPPVRPMGRSPATFRPNSELKALVMRYASEHGIPYGLADAVIRIESRYNTGARNGPHLGLTQINSMTAQSLGYQGPAAGLLDAETNLRYGLKYLAQAYRIAGGDLCGTILRYQAGHRAQVMTQAAKIYCGKVQAILAQAS